MGSIPGTAGAPAREAWSASCTHRRSCTIGSEGIVLGSKRSTPRNTERTPSCKRSMPCGRGSIPRSKGLRAGLQDLHTLRTTGAPCLATASSTPISTRSTLGTMGSTIDSKRSIPEEQQRGPGRLAALGQRPGAGDHHQPRGSPVEAGPAGRAEEWLDGVGRRRRWARGGGGGEGMRMPTLTWRQLKTTNRTPTLDVLSVTVSTGDVDDTCDSGSGTAPSPTPSSEPTHVAKES